VSPRFTLDGSETLEQHLAATADQVREEMRALVPRDRLEGLLLGGGYGRGEGGVLRTPEGDRPYNDLEFYVLLRGIAVLVERRFRDPLHALGERLSPAAGLEVEFKVLTLQKLRRSPPSMFYYDLVEGHRWLVGDERLLEGCDHHRNASAIPLAEATRLLFNRGSGLLFAAERLERPTFDAAEADFVGRNLAKAQLAFGDVLLAARGQYHWSCRERHARLNRLADEPALPLEALKRHHAEGVAFKLHPTRSTEMRESLAARHAELKGIGGKVWLWLESRRLGPGFRSAADYAAHPIRKCPETGRLRNRLINGRAFGLRGLLWDRYPRERLFHALAWLLWEPRALADPVWLRRLQQILQTHASDLPGLVHAYVRLWQRFN